MQLNAKKIILNRAGAHTAFHQDITEHKKTEQLIQRTRGLVS